MEELATPTHTHTQAVAALGLFLLQKATIFLGDFYGDYLQNQLPTSLECSPPKTQLFL